MTFAASTSSSLSLGLSIAVCTRFGDELLVRSAIFVKCAIKPATSGSLSARRARMNGVGKRPTTSCMGNPDASVSAKRRMVNGRVRQIDDVLRARETCE
jgi:hypothetical protein